MSQIRDVTAAEFHSLVSDFEKQHDTVFDARGRVVLETAARVRQGLGSRYVVDIKAPQPTSLGYLQREESVFSAMILQPVDTSNGRIVLLIAFSFLHIKDRVVYLQFYRKFVDENDPAILRDAMTKWTTAILAVNNKKDPDQNK